MKCLVFSDSHGTDFYIRRALDLNRDCDAVFFLGDGIDDVERVVGRYPDIAFFAVRGNCDGSGVFRNTMLPKIDRITLLGKKIVFTHGDLYGVKYGVGGLIKLAVEEGADILLFGHTHTPCEQYIAEYEKPFYLFNPGSISAVGRNFGILTLSENSVPLFSHGTML